LIGETSVMAKACSSTKCRTIRRTPDCRIGQSPSYLARFKNDAALEFDTGHTDVCALLTAATLLLALALLALTFLVISIFLLAATALLSAPTVSATLLSGSRRFNGFVRIMFCFRSRLPYG
jgi:hypothetical protein